MEFYNGVPVNNTEEHRRCLKFREAKIKPKSKQKKIFRVDKQQWLDYDVFANQEFNKNK